MLFAVGCNKNKTVKSVTMLSDYVKPNIGSTHSRWFFYTPGAVPFGMSKLGPSTNGTYGNEQGWEAVGYEDGHQSIEGFACFHEFQVGGLLIQPTVGVVQTIPGTLEDPSKGYRSQFDKKDEYATSGFYSVLLKDYNVKAELTATKRVGFQKYTFPKTEEANIIFDVGNQLGESGKVIDAFVKIVDDKSIEGYVITKPEYVKKYQPEAEVRMFFYAEVDKAAKGSGVFYRSKDVLPTKELKGKGVCAVLNYSTGNQEEITVKIGQSYTSIENAKLNLAAEAGSMGFAEAKSKAIDTWNTYLGRIVAEGGDEKDKVKFYTGLYHALLGRGLVNDVNGAYPMNNGDVGSINLDKDGIPVHSYYNTDAIWGGFWNLTQLWSIAYPEYYSDWVQSQLLVYNETGWLGDGIANSKYVSGVGTNFTSLAIASAYNCGIRDFDIEKGYEAALKNEVEWRDRIEGAGKMDVGAFVQNGYVSYIGDIGFNTIPEGSPFSASHTLEYSFSSYAVAQFANSLGKDADYMRLMKMSDSWKNLYDPETNLIRPRGKDGKFIEDFDPRAPWVGFQEGNAIQYTFYVPHQPKQLISLIGEDEFNNRLDSIFIRSQENIFGGGKTVNAFSGLQALYNHGNQPNLHISWLFNFSGKPWLSQKWVRAICDEFYGTDGVHGYGYGQDEDQGQLGAWYVMSAMGLFDVKGLTDPNPQFQVGSPLFDKVTIQLNKDYYLGKTFVIEAHNNSKENKYLKAIELNNQTISKPFIGFSNVVNGGKLILEMNNTPNKAIQ